MERKTIFEDKKLRLEYEPNGNYIHETWWGRTPGEIFYKLLDTLVKEMNKYNVDGLLLDAREHLGLGPEAQQTAAKTIGTYAKKHGKLKEAIIVPPDVFSKLSVTNYSKKVSEESPVTTKFFEDIESAEEWLRSE